ncbi:type II toxin-antitoxin system death-on-curing family toxin, partial [Lactobacillus crispatus]
LLFLRRNSYELTCDWQDLANQILKIAQIDDNELNYQEIYQWINQVIHEN